MARNYIDVEQVVNDFVLTMSDDDYANNVSDMVIRNHALRGIREFGFDYTSKIRSLKLTINSTTNSIDLPDDFALLSKVGYVGSDGMVYVLANNDYINFSDKYKLNSAGNPYDGDGDGLFDREASKTQTIQVNSNTSDEALAFNNYSYNNQTTTLYGRGGGRLKGAYRMNYENNRIEIDSSITATEAVIEYVADEARSSCPSVHIGLEEALRNYIYWKVILRRNTVPQSEKARARNEYFNEMRRAHRRVKPFLLDQAYRILRKNFKMSAKY